MRISDWTSDVCSSDLTWPTCEATTSRTWLSTPCAACRCRREHRTPPSTVMTYSSSARWPAWSTGGRTGGAGHRADRVRRYPVHPPDRQPRHGGSLDAAVLEQPRRPGEAHQLGPGLAVELLMDVRPVGLDGAHRHEIGRAH